MLHTDRLAELKLCLWLGGAANGLNLASALPLAPRTLSDRDFGGRDQMSDGRERILAAVRCDSVWTRMLISWRRESRPRKLRELSRFFSKQGPELSPEKISLFLIEMLRTGGAEVDHDGYYSLTEIGFMSSIALEGEADQRAREVG